MGSMAEILVSGPDFRYGAISSVRYAVCKGVSRVFACLVPFEQGAGLCEEKSTGLMGRRELKVDGAYTYHV